MKGGKCSLRRGETGLVGVTETDSRVETGKKGVFSDDRPIRNPTLSSLSSDIGESNVDKSSLHAHTMISRPCISEFVSITKQ